MSTETTPRWNTDYPSPDVEVHERRVADLQTADLREALAEMFFDTLPRNPPPKCRALPFRDQPGAIRAVFLARAEEFISMQRACSHLGYRDDA